MSSAEPDENIRAVVDRDECFGFAYCAELLPSVFSIDEEGRSVARDVGADPGRLAEAVENCPRSAIILVGQPEPPGLVDSTLGIDR